MRSCTPPFAPSTYSSTSICWKTAEVSHTVNRRRQEGHTDLVSLFIQRLQSRSCPAIRTTFCLCSILMSEQMERKQNTLCAPTPTPESVWILASTSAKDGWLPDGWDCDPEGPASSFRFFAEGPELSFLYSPKESVKNEEIARLSPPSRGILDLLLWWHIGLGGDSWARHIE